MEDESTETFNVSEVSESVQHVDEPTSAKRISGKKLRKIRKQMEFYFSDANLQRDKYLGMLVRKQDTKYIDLKIFLTFNKIRLLTDRVEDLALAISGSDVLELNSSLTKVCRKIPFVPTPVNRDEVTVYVEKLPHHANHYFVKNIFERFGAVAYVSLPFFRNTKKNKGYAFVQFVSSESVQRACESFKFSNEDNIGEHSDTQDQKFDKIVPVEKKKKKTDVCTLTNKDVSPQKTSRKRKKSGNSDKQASKLVGEDTDHKEDVSKLQKQDLLVKSIKKRKRQSSGSESSPVKKLKQNEASCIEDTKGDADTENDPSECADVKIAIESSVNKEQQQRTVETSQSIKDKDEKPVIEKTEQCNINIEQGFLEGENNDIMEDENIEGKNEAASLEQRKRKRKRTQNNDKLHLRVMNMSEFKVHRNKYLSMQRKAMSAVKKMLLLDVKQRTECESMLCHIEEKREEEKREEEKRKEKNKDDGIPFQEAVIVRITLPQEGDVPVDDELRKHLRATIKGVAYVDTTRLQDLLLHVRFEDPDSALLALENETLTELGVCEILSGEEETLYWEKIRTGRVAQRTRGRNKTRGRDKIMAKYTKLCEEQHNSHIFYD